LLNVVAQPWQVAEKGSQPLGENPRLREIPHSADSVRNDRVFSNLLEAWRWGEIGLAVVILAKALIGRSALHGWQTRVTRAADRDLAGMVVIDEVKFRVKGEKR